MRSDVATLDARLADLFSRIDSGESGQLWAQLRATASALRTAWELNDTSTILATLETLDTTLTTGTNDAHAWQDVQSLWETRCKLIATEQRSLHLLHTIYTEEQVALYTGVIMDGIHKTVTQYAEPAIARKILQELSLMFERLANYEPPKTSSRTRTRDVSPSAPIDVTPKRPS